MLKQHNAKFVIVHNFFLATFIFFCMKQTLPLANVFPYKLQNTYAFTYFENMEYSKLKHEYKRLIQAYHMRDTMHKHKIEYVNK